MKNIIKDQIELVDQKEEIEKMEKRRNINRKNMPNSIIGY